VRYDWHVYGSRPRVSASWTRKVSIFVNDDSQRIQIEILLALFLSPASFFFAQSSNTAIEASATEKDATAKKV